ncbi:Twitching mobility protein [Aquicella siphonis]|uniref:Twitching mobility protein n=1 Tax=Aquicella siphonis TaxID=254247 RepID=A0A5E4PFV4_9COXI|nr:type IV pilus twitching motility protein PilT [Aquicella siphonis]VVC75880.1 Twitching mobility protein [Aquicella siphonis]
MEIETYLKLALEQRASDVHIVPGMPLLMRIDGDLLATKDKPNFTPETAKELIYSILTKEQQGKLEKHLALDLAVNFPNVGNFRVNAFHQREGLAAVLRVIPDKVPTFDELNLPIILKRLLVQPHGLVLVTGPTGSGKSTTLASMIDFVNTMRPCHIITIEDPIEYIHKNKKCSINQLQVGRDTKSFSAALRSSLRQDPNVIMLGEMRDLETIRLALTAAETGHLVLSTMHASSAAITISRIIDVFPTSERNRVRNMLSETIEAVVCQTLVKKAASGRVAAFEVMLATPAIRHLISQGMNSHIESTIQTSGDMGMFTLEQNLKELVAKGIISQSTSRLVSSHRDSMKFSEGGKKPVNEPLGNVVNK